MIGFTEKLGGGTGAGYRNWVQELAPELGILGPEPGRPARQSSVHAPWPETFSIRHILTPKHIIRLTLLTQIVIFWKKTLGAAD